MKTLGKRIAMQESRLFRVSLRESEILDAVRLELARLPEDERSSAMRELTAFRSPRWALVENLHHLCNRRLGVSTERSA